MIVLNWIGMTLLRVVVYAWIIEMCIIFTPFLLIGKAFGALDWEDIPRFWLAMIRLEFLGRENKEE